MLGREGVERKEAYEDGTEWLHLYAQAVWHDEASIVGTRNGIEALRNALTAALANEDGVAMCEAFTADGEGYMACIHVVPWGEMSMLAMPYTDEMAASGKDCLWPHQLPRQPRHPRILPEPTPRQRGISHDD